MTIIATIGGSGSEFLISEVQRTESYCGQRPDVVWLPADKPFEDRPTHQHVVSYAEQPTAGSLAEFIRRSGFTPAPDSSIDGILSGYVDELQAAGKTALFARASMFQFFSRHCVHDVLFHIRDPLDAYLSHCQPGRNQADWDTVGYDTPASVRLFTGEWLALALEYLECKRLFLAPQLATYDDACSHASAYPFYERWEPSPGQRSLPRGHSINTWFHSVCGGLWAGLRCI